MLMYTIGKIMSLRRIAFDASGGSVAEKTTVRVDGFGNSSPENTSEAIAMSWFVVALRRLAMCTFSCVVLFLLSTWVLNVSAIWVRRAAVSGFGGAGRGLN